MSFIIISPHFLLLISQFGPLRELGVCTEITMPGAANQNTHMGGCQGKTQNYCQAHQSESTISAEVLRVSMGTRSVFSVCFESIHAS